MDYSKMKATKVKKSSSNSRVSISKSDINKSKRTMKKFGISWIIVAAFLVIGLLGGFFGTKLLTKNDTYEMVGSADIYIGKDEELDSYTELGVKCIAFGKDYSKDYKVTYYYRNDLSQKETEVEKVDETKEGIYYAVYTSPSKKYKSVKLIRNIIVLKEEDDG